MYYLHNKLILRSRSLKLSRSHRALFKLMMLDVNFRLDHAFLSQDPLMKKKRDDRSRFVKNKIKPLKQSITMLKPWPWLLVSISERCSLFIIIMVDNLQWLRRIKEHMNKVSQKTAVNACSLSNRPWCQGHAYGPCFKRSVSIECTCMISTFNQFSVARYWRCYLVAISHVAW